MLLDQITSEVLYRYVKGQAASYVLQSTFSPRGAGAPVQSGGEDSVSSVFKPLVQLVWGHVTAF